MKIPIQLNYWNHIFRNKYSFITLCLFFFLRFPSPVTAFAGHKYTIYFYNTETNINNFASLKREFDTYLSAFGEYQLQPFSEKETFEKHIARKKDGVFLISSWHYETLKKTIPMEPVLVAVSKGKSTYRRILSVKHNITDMNLLKGITVASASSEDYTRNILRKMLGKNNGSIVDSTKVLTVPKDIDSLMAVGFGVADAALTTESSLDKLMMINKKLCEMLRPLVVSEETMLPIIAIPKPFDNNCKELLKVIQEMELTVEGRNKLNMLGYDGWKELNEAEKKILEK